MLVVVLPVATAVVAAMVTPVVMAVVAVAAIAIAAGGKRDHNFLGQIYRQIFNSGFWAI